jgi:hypothetical protein
MIAVEVTYTQADFWRVVRFTTKLQTWIFTSLLMLGSMLLALLLYSANPSGFHWWAIPAIAALTLFLFYLVRLMQRFNVGRQVKSSPGINEPYVYTFDEEGIGIAGRLGNTNLKWEAIIKARETNTDFLFYTAKKFAQFLPKRAFERNEAMNELRSMLRRKLGDRAQLL